MLRNANDAIFIHDLEGNIFISNGICAALTGYSVDELHRMRIRDLLSEDEWILVKTTEQLILSGEEISAPVDVKLIRKDKTPIFIRLSFCLAPNHNNAPAFECIARDISEHKRMQDSLQYYLVQATRAQEEERKRIALELHDETIQDLVALSRQIDLLALRGKELSGENSLLLKQIRQHTTDIIQSLRHLSQDLRPATLDRLGLIPSLRHLASESAKHSDMAIKVNALGDERRLPEEMELMLFRISQEAISNTWRHSQAKNVEINVEFGERQVKVTIKDDGKGFDLTGVLNNSAKEGKLGLVGMQERAKLIDGHLIIRTELGKGTSIMIDAPL
jgi:two-component system, NarL family, sensor histidine kinase DegS